MTNNPTIDGVSRVLLTPDREMRVYIAGPMTGIEDYNFPAFNAMAEKMRAAGWHVENPADHGLVTGAEWGDYLRYDIGCLASCEAIMLLPGWTTSRGARLEVSIAKELGVAFMYAEGAENAPAVERQEPVAWPKLEAPAMVGCTRFSKGVSSRLVVEAAQRHHSYEVTPDKEAQRMVRLAEFVTAVNPPEVAALQSTIAQLQARVQELESGRGEPVAWANGEQLKLCAASPREVQPNNPMMHNLPRNIAGSALKTDYCNTPMFTAPPAPVAVVPTTEQFREAFVLSKYVDDDQADDLSEIATQACLDATAALNGVKS